MVNKPIALNPGRASRVAAVLVAAALLVTSAVLASADQSTYVISGRGKEKRAKSKDHAFLGVKMQKLTDELAGALDVEVKKGVLISEVVDDSPAQEAGLEDGDVIVAFDGEDIESPDQLRDLIAELQPGDDVKVRVMRDNRWKTIKVTLGEWPESPAIGFVAPNDFVPRVVEFFSPHRLGVRVHEMNEELASYFGIDEDAGVLVLSVDEESVAEEMGIKSGDVITEVAGEDARSAEDIREALSDVDDGDQVTVHVVREKKKLVLEGEMKLGQNAFRFDRWNWSGSRAPRVFIDGGSDFRKELDELRKEIEELRKELEESKES